jgi:hypothetical protein
VHLSKLVLGCCTVEEHLHSMCEAVSLMPAPLALELPGVLTQENHIHTLAVPHTAQRPLGVHHDALPSLLKEPTVAGLQWGRADVRHWAFESSKW